MERNGILEKRSEKIDLKFISKQLKKKINNIIESPNSEIEKAWKEYSKDKMFDDPCEEFREERAYKAGFNAGRGGRNV